jgi:hypothetical protein
MTGPRLVRLGTPMPKSPNRAQWTFRGQRSGWTWTRTAQDGTIIRASDKPLPSLELAKQDARLAGWTPQQTTCAFKVE